MKRLAWLWIALFCTAVAQVQQVDLAWSTGGTCPCCEDQPGACGMPDCAPAPACGQALLGLRAATTVQSEVREVAKLSQAPSEPFYFSMVRPAVVPRAPLDFPVARFAASASLFEVHCSFLI